MPQHLVAFIVLQIVVLAVFSIGMIGNAAFWLGGGIAPGRDASPWEKLRFLAASAARVFDRRALVEISLDWLLQRRLLRLSRLRWVMHLCFFWGFVILFFVGSVGLMLAERGLLSIAKDDPWFAFTNDFAGGMLIFAVGVAMYRRLVLKERQLRTGPGDIAIMVLLAGIVLSGYLLEATRLISREVPGEIGWYSFVGYPLSLALRRLSLDWWAVEGAIWWVHVVSGMAFVAYLPYSKLVHLIAGPLVIAGGTLSHGTLSRPDLPATKVAGNASETRPRRVVRRLTVRLRADFATVAAVLTARQRPGGSSIQARDDA
ncbi:MAG: respiratory nitrate reductase subunit gamma [Chloroflexi bacterium]|nr:respiratory nitrate reductase subunit gamma [Chloroflexota bacterium]